MQPSFRTDSRFPTAADEKMTFAALVMDDRDPGGVEILMAHVPSERDSRRSTVARNSVTSSGFVR
jgi:hypothetical protein